MNDHITKLQETAEALEAAADRIEATVEAVKATALRIEEQVEIIRAARRRASAKLSEIANQEVGNTKPTN